MNVVSKNEIATIVAFIHTSQSDSYSVSNFEIGSIEMYYNIIGIGHLNRVNVPIQD